MRFLHFFFIIIFLAIHTSCTTNQNKVDIEKGKTLATQYCQSCHLLPDPALLDKKTWTEGIMPNMGPRLGIFSFQGKNYPTSRYGTGIPSNFYPDHPMMTESEWSNLIAYYSATAPDTLMPTSKQEPAITSGSIFKVVAPDKYYENPVSTFISIDTVSHQLLQAEGQRRWIYIYSDQLKLVDSATTSSMIVDIVRKKNELLLCNIGVINPNDGQYGKIQQLTLSKKGSSDQKTILLFDSLRRPVEMRELDLNGDHRDDLLICEFGNLLGALSWLENMGNNHYRRHVLREAPGAIHTVIDDYNHDGLPDIWVLFAQGDEGIVLFTNKGNGEFEQQQILRFPSVYGSTYFELADFNGDGYPDILYSAGDNADFSQVLKPYHGVYIFMNDGQRHFKQSYFFPMHGCFKVLARDFDNDGDLDIAAISFFADYVNDPEEGFVYLENRKNGAFKSFSLAETERGRWLTMDAGDLDGDGRTDIVLGNLSTGPTKLKSRYDWKKAPPFLLLKNIGAPENAKNAIKDSLKTQ